MYIFHSLVLPCTWGSHHVTCIYSYRRQTGPFEKLLLFPSLILSLNNLFVFLCTQSQNLFSCLCPNVYRMNTLYARDIVQVGANTFFCWDSVDIWTWHCLKVQFTVFVILFLIFQKMYSYWRKLVDAQYIIAQAIKKHLLELCRGKYCHDLY